MKYKPNVWYRNTNNPDSNIPVHPEDIVSIQYYNKQLTCNIKAKDRIWTDSGDKWAIEYFKIVKPYENPNPSFMVSFEFSVEWIAKNPTDYANNVLHMYRTYSETEYNIGMDTTKAGYLTFTITKKGE